MSATRDAPGRGGRRRAGAAGSRLRARLARVSRAAWIGWGGVALGVLAFYVTLPPLLLRTIVPSLVLAAAGIALAVVAMRAGEKRVGWGAIVACVARRRSAPTPRSTPARRTSSAWSSGRRCWRPRCATRRR